MYATAIFQTNNGAETQKYVNNVPATAFMKQVSSGQIL